MKAIKQDISFICIICVIIMYITCGSAFADTGKEQPIVTLFWNENRIDINETDWNGRSVLISTEDAGIGDDNIYHYIGVKISDLMELAGAEECTWVVLKSSDGMTGEISAEDIRNYDIALVNRYDDGKPIEANAGGPVKVVFPITEHPELEDTYTMRSWQWYVSEVEFVKKPYDAPSTEAAKEPDNVSQKELGNVYAMESEREPDDVYTTEHITEPGDVSSETFTHADNCIIIVLDGFSSSYLSQLGPGSNLAKLSENGACCLTARSTYPTHTCTNCATIMTDVGSARHGIVGNNRLGDEDVMSSVKNIQPEMIQVPTLFEIASKAGKKTAFVSGKDNLLTQ